MSKTKIIFIGNPIAGDDGIGPFLYNELKDNPKLKDFELKELGVIGLDLISYVEEDDNMIIVDAAYSKDKKKIGTVSIMNEKNLNPDFKLASVHDLGIEQTIPILRSIKPDIKEINIIAINTDRPKSFSNELSPKLTKNIENIKQEVLNAIETLTK